MAKQVSSTAEMIDYLISFFIPPVSTWLNVTNAWSIEYYHSLPILTRPKLGVFFKRGCGADVLINILLTILGWLPGVLHAWWIIG